MKTKQILDAFKDELESPVTKYVCAPCSNCKGNIRELIKRYDLEGNYNIIYSGLVELVANAMTDMVEPFLEDITLSDKVTEQVPVEA